MLLPMGLFCLLGSVQSAADASLRNIPRSDDAFLPEILATIGFALLVACAAQTLRFANEAIVVHEGRIRFFDR